MNIKEIKFKAKNIEALEKNTAKSLYDFVDGFSVESVATLLKYAFPEEQNTDVVYDFIDTYLAEGNELFDLNLVIIDALENQGFLLKRLQIKKLLTQEVDRKAKELSQKLGEVEKQKL